MVNFLKQPGVISDYTEIETTLERVFLLWDNDPLRIGHPVGEIVHPQRCDAILATIQNRGEIDMPHFRFWSVDGKEWLEIEEGRHRLAVFRTLCLQRIWVAIHPDSSRGAQEALKP